MSSIDLLPSHPENKTGWPWTEASDPLPPHMPGGAPWPKISIVTPSYNQAKYLEETIRSVLLQGYPNLEYIIIDGGSTDGSIEIIKKYEPWINYWISEKDRGQSHAINKGFDQSTGEIMAWINSDDYYAKNAFAAVAMNLTTQKILWVTGKSYTVRFDGTSLQRDVEPNHDIRQWYIAPIYSQPSIFWKRKIWISSGGINESLHYSFDYDLWLKFVKTQPFAYWINEYLAYFRHQPESKTLLKQEEFIIEDLQIHKKYKYPNSNVFDCIYIWKKRRDRRLSYYLKLGKNKNNILKQMLIIFSTAPWCIFNKNYINFIK
jgi:glycosyltransferase involved in cell wall biosynthesis